MSTLIVAVTLIGSNYLVAFFTARSRRFCVLIEGKPVVLARDGKLRDAALRSNHVPPSDVEEAVRAANVESVEEVKLATLEVSGEITIVPK